jgi:hypothetical protein
MVDVATLALLRRSTCLRSRLPKRSAPWRSRWKGSIAWVFTGGIGEHAAKVRALSCDRLRRLGVELDASANGPDAGLVSLDSSSVEIRVIPASEETTIAKTCTRDVYVIQQRAGRLLLAQSGRSSAGWLKQCIDAAGSKMEQSHSRDFDLIAP